MKAAKALAIFAIVIFFSLNAGCMSKKWSYNFTSLSASLGDWYHEITGDYRLDGDGLCLKNGTITTPVYFSVDQIVKIVLVADVEDSAGAFLEFGITDGILWSGNNETWTTMRQIGVVENESWKLGDFGGSGQVDQEHDEPVPKFDYDGPNLLEFSRIGTKVTLSINGDEIGSIDLIHFDVDTDGFFPTFSAGGEFGTLTFKTIEIWSNGDVSEEWPIPPP